jgi:hypothetical protein
MKLMNFFRNKRFCLFKEELPNRTELPRHESSMTHHNNDSSNSMSHQITHSTNQKPHSTSSVNKPHVTFTLPVLLPVDQRLLHRFLYLIDSTDITNCLKHDVCNRFSDKYLIAQTFVYFCRCSFSPDQFTISNFYLLLYLANDQEEDLDFKLEILPWCMGSDWRNRFGEFQKEKEILWKKMKYKSVVYKEELEQIIYFYNTNHWVWRREREKYHSGAIRDCHRPTYEVQLEPQGKYGNGPMKCDYCHVWKIKMNKVYWSDHSSETSPILRLDSSRNILSDSSDSDSAYQTSNNSSLYKSVHEITF